VDTPQRKNVKTKWGRAGISPSELVDLLCPFDAT